MNDINNDDNEHTFDDTVNGTYLSYDEENVFDFILDLKPENGITQSEIENFCSLLFTVWHHNIYYKKHVLKVVKFIQSKNYDMKKKMKILKIDMASLNSKIKKKKTNDKNIYFLFFFICKYTHIFLLRFFVYFFFV